MPTSEIELDSPVFRALGPRFKLTEVFLSDDGWSSDNRLAASLPKHIRFKYDSDDDDNVNGNNGDSSNTCLQTVEDSVPIEDDDLTQQMSALGLPLCFQTSKKRTGKSKKKSKATQHKQQQSQKSSDDQVQESCRQSKESLFHADFPDKSCNYSSLSLPNQTEVSSSGSDVDDEISRCTANPCGDKPANEPSEATNLHMETEMLSMAATPDSYSGNACSRSYILNDGIEQQKEMDISLTEHFNVEGSDVYSNVMELTDLGSSNTMEQTQAAPDLSKEPQYTAVHGHDDNTECNSSQYESVICSGTCGDWSAFWDSFYMRYYFYNAKTLESTWYPPPGMGNFDFGDISCKSGESNAELSVINLNPATPGFEEEKADEYELVEETGLDEQRVDAMQGLQVNLADAVSTDETYIANATDLQTLDGNCHNEISLAISSDVREQTCLEDIEMKANDLSMEDIPASFKRRKTRKNRRRKKSSLDNEGHELDITKYWCQRYLLFSKFDSGVKMDEEGWFSVTPEAIASHQALHAGNGIIMDCFAGVGGNAIQFAKTGNHVIAIDIDPKKIDYAHHNAAIYGVEDKIDFIVGDSLLLGAKLKADTIFLSPPWGGPDYAKVESYDINMLQPYDGQFLFSTFKTIASMIIMFLPRNVNLVQLAELALSVDSAWSLEVEKNYLNGKLKAVTAYLLKTLEHN